MVGEITSSKEHLKRNTFDFKFGKVKSLKSGNSLFQHEVPAFFHVRTENLWESSRTYIWKHLGTSSWTMDDGTIVTFSRIHQK